MAQNARWRIKEELRRSRKKVNPPKRARGGACYTIVGNSADEARRSGHVSEGCRSTTHMRTAVTKRSRGTPAHCKRGAMAKA